MDLFENCHMVKIEFPDGASFALRREDCSELITPDGQLMGSSEKVVEVFLAKARELHCRELLGRC